jgi:hypothetical protein
MKLKVISLGILASFIFLGLFISQQTEVNKTSAYTPRKTQSDLPASWNGASQFLHSLRANPATGELDIQAMYAAKDLVKQKGAQRANSLDWEDIGPTNFGGRTRAILFDRTDPTGQTVYAGSVTGGLFKSTNTAGLWDAVDGFPSLSISCITQTLDGTIYFGTGSTFEGNVSGNGGSSSIGTGVYKFTPGNEAATLTQIQSTIPVANATGVPWSFVNFIKADPNGNRVYACTNVGLFYTDDAGNTWTDAINSSLEFQDVDVASNGLVVATTSSRIYTSSTGNAGSFTLNTTTDIGHDNASQGAPLRLEVVIAPSNPDHIYVLIVNTNRQWGGLYESKNGGTSWQRIYEPSAGFAPFASLGSGQGFYDAFVSCAPDNENLLFIGGVRLWRYDGNWTRATFEFGDQQAQYSGFYMHSDKHTYEYSHVDPKIFLVGNDGGISKSLDGGQTFFPASRGFNATQFYAMSTNERGWVLGGTQDNGTILVDQSNPNFPLDGNRIGGGDGFGCALSNYTDVNFSSIYYGYVRRGVGTNTGGEICGGWGTCAGSDPADDNSFQPADPNFYTPIGFWESIDDQTSQSEIEFVAEDGSSEFVILSTNGISKNFTGTINLPQASSKIVVGSIAFNAGNQVLSDPDGDGVLTGDGSGSIDYATAAYTLSFNNVPSNGTALASSFQLYYDIGDVLQLSSNTPGVSRLNTAFKLNHTLTSALNPGDTLRIQDPVQSVLAFGASDNNAYILRDATNINKTADWWPIRYEYTNFTEDFDNLNFPTWNQIGGSVTQNCASSDVMLVMDDPTSRILQSNPMKISSGMKVGFDFYVGGGNCDAPDANDTLYFETRTTISGNVNNWTKLLTLLPGDYNSGMNRVKHTFTGVSIADSVEVRWRQGHTTYTGNNDVLGIDNIRMTRTFGVGEVQKLDFSSDGNHLFVASKNGQVIRISGINNVYSASDAEPINGKVDVAVIHSDNTGRVMAGLGIDPTNNDNLIITLGGYGSAAPHVLLTTQATTADTTGNGPMGAFTSIQGDLPQMPVFDALISFDQNKTIVLGTDNGPFVAELADVQGGLGTWNTVPNTHPLSGVPIFEVIQQDADFWNSYNTGEIYLGTHGRGFWKSTNLVGIPDFESTNNAGIEKLLVYPNPMSSQGMIEFELTENDFGTIKILDINGRLVKLIETAAYSKGVNSIPIDVSGLNSGNYFALLELKSNAKLAKFIVQ